MAKKKYDSNNKDYIILRIPTWVTKAYIMMATVLLPWTIYLGITLPRHHLTSHWDVSWAGFDVGLIISLAATGICAYMRSVWLVIAAASTGSLLMVDAWFDVLSERTASNFRQAVILAIVFELPLACLSYYLASHALYHNTKKNARGTMNPKNALK